MTAIERLLGAPVGSEADVPLDLIVTDDWTTPSLEAPLDRLGTRRSAVPIVLVHDHTRDAASYAGAERERVERLTAQRDAFVRRYGAQLVEGRGIQHHVLPTLGLLKPGMRLLGNDSHTPTLGAYGVAAFAGQPATIAAAIHHGRLTVTVPETLRVVLHGHLPADATARDAALTLAALLADEDGVPRRAVGRALEFCGPGVAGLSLSERAVLANLAPEVVAATALFPVDVRTSAALGLVEGQAALSNGVPSSADYEVVLDLAGVRPSVARGPSPTDVIAVAALERTRVDRICVGTCAGGGYEEIVAFAAALRGPVVVPTQLTPASDVVARRLAAAGTLERLTAAGVEITPPGCGACFGFGVARLEAGQVALSTGNRNARGRLGSRDATVHLVSGRSAGLAACSGVIGGTGPAAPLRPASAPTVRWPTEGNVVRLRGTVTTDDLIPSSLPGIGTSNDSDPAVLRRLLLHHVDASAADRDLRGAVLVADDAFGAGSNRASSVRALQAAGIRLVVARSVAPLYAMGARDEGFPVLTCSDDRFYRMLDDAAAGADSTITIDGAGKVVRVARGSEVRSFRTSTGTPASSASGPRN